MSLIIVQNMKRQLEASFQKYEETSSKYRLRKDKIDRGRRVQLWTHILGPKLSADMRVVKRTEAKEIYSLKQYLADTSPLEYLLKKHGRGYSAQAIAERVAHLTFAPTGTRKEDGATATGRRSAPDQQGDGKDTNYNRSDSSDDEYAQVPGECDFDYVESPSEGDEVYVDGEDLNDSFPAFEIAGDTGKGIVTAVAVPGLALKVKSSLSPVNTGLPSPQSPAVPKLSPVVSINASPQTGKSKQQQSQMFTFSAPASPSPPSSLVSPTVSRNETALSPVSQRGVGLIRESPVSTASSGPGSRPGSTLGMRAISPTLMPVSPMASTSTPREEKSSWFRRQGEKKDNTTTGDTDLAALLSLPSSTRSTPVVLKGTPSVAKAFYSVDTAIPFEKVLDLMDANPGGKREHALRVHDGLTDEERAVRQEYSEALEKFRVRARAMEQKEQNQVKTRGSTIKAAIFTKHRRSVRRVNSLHRANLAVGVGGGGSSLSPSPPMSPSPVSLMTAAVADTGASAGGGGGLRADVDVGLVHMGASKSDGAGAKEGLGGQPQWAPAKPAPGEEAEAEADPAFVKVSRAVRNLQEVKDAAMMPQRLDPVVYLDDVRRMVHQWREQHPYTAKINKLIGSGGGSAGDLEESQEGGDTVYGGPLLAGPANRLRESLGLSPQPREQIIMSGAGAAGVASSFLNSRGSSSRPSPGHSKRPSISSASGTGPLQMQLPPNGTTTGVHMSSTSLAVSLSATSSSASLLSRNSTPTFGAAPMHVHMHGHRQDALSASVGSGRGSHSVSTQPSPAAVAAAGTSLTSSSSTASSSHDKVPLSSPPSPPASPTHSGAGGKRVVVPKSDDKTKQLNRRGELRVGGQFFELFDPDDVPIPFHSVYLAEQLEDIQKKAKLLRDRDDREVHRARNLYAKVKKQEIAAQQWRQRRADAKANAQRIAQQVVEMVRETDSDAVAAKALASVRAACPPILDMYGFVKQRDLQDKKGNAQAHPGGPESVQAAGDEAAGGAGSHVHGGGNEAGHGSSPLPPHTQHPDDDADEDEFSTEAKGRKIKHDGEDYKFAREDAEVSTSTEGLHPFPSYSASFTPQQVHPHARGHAHTVASQPLTFHRAVSRQVLTSIEVVNRRISNTFPQTMHEDLKMARERQQQKKKQQIEHGHGHGQGQGQGYRHGHAHVHAQASGARRPMSAPPL